MAQMTFGEILRAAREHKGLDVAAAARMLRIRPDILRAIEAEDFSRMPPRGYTRNMVNAYARLVDLNPTEITRMYLDAAYAFQVGKARTSSPSDTGSYPRRSRQAPSGRSRNSSADDRAPRQTSLGRRQYDDRRTFSSGGYDAPSGGLRTRQSDRTHPSRTPALGRTQYTNFYAGPQNSGVIQSRLPFIIAGVVILVLLIVILFLIFGGNKEETQDQTNTVPITGLNDTTQSSDGDTSGDQQQQVLTPPTSVTVEYRVGSTDAYVEITTDGGTAEPAYLSAGSVETIEVTGTWSIATWTTDLITVTVDGEEVEFQQTGTSIPTCTIDFNTYLQQWAEENNQTLSTSSSSTTGTNGGTATATASAGGVSATSTTDTSGSSGTASSSN